MSAQSASVAASKPPAWARPALFTRISMPPNSAAARSTTRAGSGSCATSAAMAKARMPYCCAISCAAASSRAAPRATSTTLAPFAASSPATARPTPRLAPVTIATLPRIPSSMLPPRSCLRSRHAAILVMPAQAGIQGHGTILGATWTLAFARVTALHAVRRRKQVLECDR
jgi:hypothetical protein